MVAFFSGGALFLGYNEGFTSLAGRAFGAGEMHIIGKLLNKTFFILGIIFIFFTTIALYSDLILIFLGLPKGPSILAAEYLKFFLPAIFCFFVFDALRAYLNCMKIYHVHSTICLITAIFHPILCYFLIDIGFHGIPIAISIT